MDASPDRKARWSLGWGLVGFAAWQVALGLAMEAWRPELRDRDYPPKRAALAARLARAPGRPLVVMLGSSRTLFGFRAGLLDGRPGPGGRPVVAFNLGLPAAGPLREGLCLRHLLQEGARPDLLLVEVMPILFDEPGPGVQCEENWLYIPSLAGSDMLRLRPYFTRPDHLVRAWLRSRLMPSYSHRLSVQEYLTRKGLGPWARERLVLKDMDPWGWVPALPSDFVVPAEMRQIGIEATRRRYAADLAAFHVGSKAARALADLLERCRRERIPAALVLMPEGPAFRSWYSPTAEAELRSLLAAVRRAYPVGLIDARDWIDEEGFLDSHHLLPGGAARFSARFARLVLALWTGTAGGRAATPSGAGLPLSPELASFPAAATPPP